MSVTKIRYIQGGEPAGPECVSFELTRPDTPVIKGVLIADFLMSAGYRGFDGGELTESEARELVEYIREKRNEIKFDRPKYDVYEWSELGFPLEDYLPLHTNVDDDFLSIFYWLDDTGDIRQWIKPYEAPADREKLDTEAYHTFIMSKGKWEYAGICAKGSTENLVPEIGFNGKNGYSGSGGLVGE